ncbi:CAP domain-containing protein [Natribaculum luteum]|uniref:CAP domain-containing protein n=1 Tax=Natribaculum luteum TaxID=1586232 RepID=A0ABD5P148_9EURY|nr:CAP domain-containing protein [Natribaculum luteum]
MARERDTTDQRAVRLLRWFGIGLLVVGLALPATVAAGVGQADTQSNTQLDDSANGDDELRIEISLSDYVTSSSEDEAASSEDEDGLRFEVSLSDSLSSEDDGPAESPDRSSSSDLVVDVVLSDETADDTESETTDDEGADETADDTESETTDDSEEASDEESGDSENETGDESADETTDDEEERTYAAQVELAIHDEVNEIRAEHGLDPLEFDEQLAGVARGHSEDMAENDYFSHTSPDGSTVGDRYADAGVSCQAWGENILYNYHSDESPEVAAQKSVEMWMNSDGHRENILSDRWDSQGIGVTVAADGRLYATQNFGTNCN